MIYMTLFKMVWCIKWTSGCLCEGFLGFLDHLAACGHSLLVGLGDFGMVFFALGKRVVEPANALWRMPISNSAFTKLPNISICV